MSRDYTKYWLNGNKYPKSRLVLAVVKEYLAQYPQLTFSDLKMTFPDHLQGKLGVVQMLKTVIKNEKQKRYFTKNEDILTDGNNEKIVVCNQWGVDDSGKGNFYDFLQHAKKYNFDIQADISLADSDPSQVDEKKIDSNDDNDSEDSSEKVLLELVKTIYPEEVSLVAWRLRGKDTQSGILMLVRELRRGWYFEILADIQNNTSNQRVFEAFLPVLDYKEKAWPKLTKNASKSDWENLDALIKLSWVIPGSKMFLAGPELLGASVAEQAMEQFGFYVPDNDLLPALIWESKKLNLILSVYLKYPGKFAGESMLTDNNIDECEVFNSLAKAVKTLAKKAYYYIQES